MIRVEPYIRPFMISSRISGFICRISGWPDMRKNCWTIYANLGLKMCFTKVFHFPVSHNQAKYIKILILIDSRKKMEIFWSCNKRLFREKCRFEKKKKNCAKEVTFRMVWNKKRRVIEEYVKKVISPPKNIFKKNV